MVLPALLAVAGGAALAGGILQYMNSEEARKLSREQFAEIQALYDKVKQPNFDMSQLTPEDFRVVQQYVPQQAEYVAEANPTLVSASSSDARAGRDAQLAALQRLRTVGEGTDPFQAAAINQAQNAAAQNAQSQRQTILQNAQRRGMANSGLAFASQLGATQDQMNQGAQLGLQAAMDRYSQGLNALRQSADLGGQIRGEDVSLSEKNAGIINAFNQRNQANQQNYANAAAGTANDAQKYNIGQAQQIANANTQQHNDYAKYNQQYGNDMKQQAYQNALGMVRSKQGLASDISNNTMAGARDQNQAIQGVTNAVIGGAQYATNPENKKNIFGG